MEPLILRDHTWVLLRKKVRRTYLLVEGFAVPRWMGGSYHIPSAAAAVITAIASALIVGTPAVVLLPPIAGWIIFAVAVLGPFVFMWGFYERVDPVGWIARQFSWWRQPHRVSTQASGGVEPDEIHQQTILWRPADRGFKARIDWFTGYNSAQSRRARTFVKDDAS